jgi:Integrase zinc binding domain
LRWGASPVPQVARVRQVAVVDRVSPLQDVGFHWPNASEIATIQQQALESRDPHGPLPNVHLDDERGVQVSDTGKVWVPDEALDLQRRLCVVGHAGSSGHRGVKTTTLMLASEFCWATLAEDVKSFVQDCLHCKCVRGEMVPRPFGSTMHATKPNHLIHFDFLTMPMSLKGTQYVLVIKDDMSGFCVLIKCAAADALAVQEGLLDWFKLFGVCEQWVSDQGSHSRIM